jgi:hypothetical protein
MTLPVPVSRNRFAVPLCVFIFGMVAVVSIPVAAAAAGHAAVTYPGACAGVYCRPGDATG